MAYFVILSWHLLEGLRKITERLSIVMFGSKTKSGYIPHTNQEITASAHVLRLSAVDPHVAARERYKCKTF